MFMYIEPYSEDLSAIQYYSPMRAEEEVYYFLLNDKHEIQQINESFYNLLVSFHLTKDYPLNKRIQIFFPRLEMSEIKLNSDPF